jgi:hypothetical protein
MLKQLCAKGNSYILTIEVKKNMIFNEEDEWEETEDEEWEEEEW